MAPTNLTDKYEGEELVETLRGSFPDQFSRTLSERHLCCALDIVRWMASIIVEGGSDIPDDLYSDIFLSFALADFTITSRDKSKAYRMNKLLKTHQYDFILEDNNTPNLFDILEGPLMVEILWSDPRNLLYEPTVSKPIKMSVQDIAKDSLTTLEDPTEFAPAIGKKLGMGYPRDTQAHGYCVPTPPEFLRFRWNNSSWAALNSYKEPLELLRTLEILNNDAFAEDSDLKASISSVSYQLICISRIPLPGEEPVAAHFYTCDGDNFRPPYGVDRNEYWSCKEPGSYYLIYHKSTHPRPEMEVEVANQMPK